jgi:hypothetical protein
MGRGRNEHCFSLPHRSLNYRRSSWTKVRAENRFVQVAALAPLARRATARRASVRLAIHGARQETPATTTRDIPPWRARRCHGVTSSKPRTFTSTPSIILGSCGCKARRHLDSDTDYDDSPKSSSGFFIPSKIGGQGWGGTVHNRRIMWRVRVAQWTGALYLMRSDCCICSHSIAWMISASTVV